MSNSSHHTNRRVYAPPQLNPYDEPQEEKYHNQQQQQRHKQYEPEGKNRERGRRASEQQTASSSYHFQSGDQDDVYHKLDYNSHAMGNPHGALPPPPPPLPPPAVVPVPTGTLYSDPAIQQQQQQQSRLHEIHGRAPPPRRVPTETVLPQRAAQPRAPFSRGPNSTTLIKGTEADQVTASISRASGGGSSCREAQPSPSIRTSQELPRSSSSGHQAFSNRTAPRDDDAYSGGKRGQSGSGEEHSQSFVREERQPQQQPAVVIQGAFTQQNPFRRQTFEEFCCFPEYSAPSNFPTYQVVSGDWMGFQRATEAVSRDQHHMMTVAQADSVLSTTYPILPAAVSVLRTGDWFLKWTRYGRVHDRFVWLDTNSDAIVWGPHLRSPYVLLSHLRLADIVDIHPECVCDESTRRTVYRFTFITEGRSVVFATEVRDKFDFWFSLLQNIISVMGLSAKRCRVWGSPGSQASARAIKTGAWASRGSPLHAILNGHETSLSHAAAGSMLTSTHGQVLPSD